VLRISIGNEVSKCFEIDIETKKTWILIQKAKDWGISKRKIIPKHYNPFLKKYIIHIFI
jgi:hypothetical protein